MTKASAKTVENVLFDAANELGALQQLFECVNKHAGAIIAEGGFDEDVERLALTIECVAEKGVRMSDEIMVALHKARVKHGANGKT